MIATDPLPLTETVTPTDLAGVAAAVAQAAAARTPVYPLGGGTSLDYGLVPRAPGVGLALAGLARVIDYPARDMTITAEAGITIAELARVLDAERQWLPIEVPHPDRATLGGVIATAWSGPRRYGWGTPRDYVIGVSAVDGRGMPFKGGGRVVKNVAGYDFCKLLTGSLGTLGVITQVTLKIRPQPAATALVVCRPKTWQEAERLLAGLVNSATTPSAIELLAGSAASAMPLADEAGVATLLVGLDGSAAEVDWMLVQLEDEWQAQGIRSIAVVKDAPAKELWEQLAGFPSAAEAPLVLKASLRPSATVAFVKLLLEIDPGAAIQAHAGTGVVIARFAEFQPAAVSRALIGRLQPAAVAAGGHAVVLSSSFAADLTRQAVWAGAEDATSWMVKVKQQFDPHDILNPGRFVYGRA